MTVTVRKYKRGGWEVDIRIISPRGVELRERRRAPVSTKDQALRWGRARESLLLSQTEMVLSQKEVARFRDFAEEFMATYVRSNNKPSERASKRDALEHDRQPAA